MRCVRYPPAIPITRLPENPQHPAPRPTHSPISSPIRRRAYSDSALGLATTRACPASAPSHKRLPTHITRPRLTPIALTRRFHLSPSPLDHPHLSHLSLTPSPAHPHPPHTHTQGCESSPSALWQRETRLTTSAFAHSRQECTQEDTREQRARVCVCARAQYTF